MCSIRLGRPHPKDHYARQARNLVLVQDELRSVGEFVLRQPGGHLLVQFHQRFDVVQ